MKTIAILTSLALTMGSFAAPAPEPQLSAAAQSNVLLDKDANFLGRPGRFINPEILTGVCFNVPANFDNQISAVSPNGDIKCVLYDGRDCTGATPAAGPIFGNRPRVQNLALPPWNFDDRVSSLLCTPV
ncbi:hypothetical protein P154DRAFT_624636 [Amniculicola lignicola CBS 123094]|uniref:Uncharacterized protein n=1 Tax=Amniculicola lignicola CBS 123094 TaxID=1392246 RepID=A0A6A5W0N8_9PLEO|nr:hypothetical protein P154DRAFT_624636 [Amniculicola lignicola CBS 123094]